jgi:hypothetical protein
MRSSVPARMPIPTPAREVVALPRVSPRRVLLAATVTPTPALVMMVRVALSGCMLGSGGLWGGGATPAMVTNGGMAS